MGTVLEWDDFAISACCATQIGRTWFITRGHVARILAAFGIFAPGCLMRPLCGALIGPRRAARHAALARPNLGSLTVYRETR